MYRVVGVLARERGIAPEDPAALQALVAGLDVRFSDGGARVHAGGRDLTEAIRRPEAGEWASRVSTVPIVRQRLVALQRAFAAAGGVVMEGRDIGTVVFPDAALKFYLTADPAARARRRAAELRAGGERVDESALARDLAERDRRDAGRAHSPLRPAPDAVILDTTALSLDEVVDRMAAVARERGVDRS
jgi:cytidylate kinase